MRKPIWPVVVVCAVLSPCVAGLYFGGGNPPAPRHEGSVPAVIGSGAYSAVISNSSPCVVPDGVAVTNDAMCAIYANTVGTTSGTLSIGISSIGITGIVSSGSVTMQPRPAALYCTADGCSAHAGSMEEAQALLDRVAARGLRVDVSVETPANYCHPQHETIEPRPSDVVASIAK